VCPEQKQPETKTTFSIFSCFDTIRLGIARADSREMKIEYKIIEIDISSHNT